MHGLIRIGSNYFLFFNVLRRGAKMSKKIFNFNAVALALLTTGNAWALTPADGLPDLTLYIPGSQANDPAFGFLVNNLTVANAVCEQNALPAATNDDVATTTHIYFQGGINDNYSTVYCYTNSTLIPGLTGGVTATVNGATVQNHSKLLISRRRLGASGVGLDAVAHGTKLTYLSGADLAGCTFGNGSYSSGGATYQFNYSCPTPTDTHPASGATSDVTPDVFFAPDNVYNGTTPIEPGQITTVHAIGGHVIGTPVTLLLRNALQYAEIQAGMLPATCTVGSEIASCVPSLSKEQLVSIFSGAITDWTQLQVTPSQNLGQIVAAGITAGADPSPSNPKIGLKNPLDTTVHICRREPGAGQQVALLANVLQYPCLGNYAPQLVDNTALSDVEYATSLGAVDKCLADFNDGSTGYFGTSNPTGIPQPPASSIAHGKQWAIGIQTTERNATNAANYRFIAHDWALPTAQEAYLNHYRLVGNYALSWNATDANTVAALNAIVNYSGMPSTIASRNGSLSLQSFGQAGYIALSDNGYTPPLTWDPSNPVSPYSRLNGSGTPNACVLPVANSLVGQVPLNNQVGTGVNAGSGPGGAFIGGN
jgi:hypothetical protein